MLKKLKILNKLIILSVVSRMQKQNSVIFFFLLSSKSLKFCSRACFVQKLFHVAVVLFVNVIFS